MEEKTKKELIEKVKEFFRNTRKTNWGKNQIVSKLKDLEIEYLKEKLEKSN